MTTTKAEKAEKKKHPGGRPSEYKPSYVAEAYKYLELCQDEVTEFHKTRGEKSDSYDRLIKVNLPTVEGFARYLKVATKSLNNWANTHPEFLRALDDIKDVQKQVLIEKGLSGEYSPMIAKLVLSANHGMVERIDKTTDGKPMPQPIINVHRND